VVVTAVATTLLTVGTVDGSFDACGSFDAVTTGFVGALMFPLVPEAPAPAPAATNRTNEPANTYTATFRLLIRAHRKRPRTTATNAEMTPMNPTTDTRVKKTDMRLAFLHAAGVPPIFASWVHLVTGC
jgi:hypothetical protein